MAVQYGYAKEQMPFPQEGIYIAGQTLYYAMHLTTLTGYCILVVPKNNVGIATTGHFLGFFAIMQLCIDINGQ